MMTLPRLLRVMGRQIKARYFGTLVRFEGNAKEICQQIVDNTWSGQFYRTSLGHYDYFWMRDFGTVADALVHTGNKERVQQTLRWALKSYRRAGTVALCIDPKGNVFNAPARMAIDALPWLLHSLVVSEYPLNQAERDFLDTRLRHYSKKFLNKHTGMIKPRVRYNELRDAVHYNRSAYSIALVGRLATCAPKLGLTAFGFSPETYRHLLLDLYWNGKFFKADFSNDIYSSESALMPFFLGVVDDARLFEKTVDYIYKEKLNKPYPLKYSQHSNRQFYRFGMGPIFMPNYTGDTIWTWHATFYLHLLRRYKHPAYKLEKAQFAKLIERHGSYPELVNPDGSWYYAPFYRADPGMVWAALYLALD